MDEPVRDRQNADTSATRRRDRRRFLMGGASVGLLAGSLGRRSAGAATAGPTPSTAGLRHGPANSVARQVPEDCPLFPEDNVWNTPIDDLPTHDRSDAWVASIGTEIGLHCDFGAGSYEGGPLGIPFVRVPADQPAVEVTFEVAEESDPGPYPIPEDALIEGGPDGTGDRHVIVVQEGTCLLFELYNATPQPTGGWAAFSGARYDLTSNDLRPEGWTSADAAGMPILPGLVRHEEIDAGVIPHALRFTASTTQ